jgi:hypothetical protein
VLAAVLKLKGYEFENFKFKNKMFCGKLIMPVFLKMARHDLLINYAGS